MSDNTASSTPQQQHTSEEQDMENSSNSYAQTTPGTSNPQAHQQPVPPVRQDGLVTSQKFHSQILWAFDRLSDSGPTMLHTFVQSHVYNDPPPRHPDLDEFFLLENLGDVLQMEEEDLDDEDEEDYEH